MAKRSSSKSRRSSSARRRAKSMPRRKDGTFLSPTSPYGRRVLKQRRSRSSRSRSTKKRSSSRRRRSTIRRSASRGSSGRGEIRVVRDRAGKVTGFQRMVPVTTKTGKRSTAMRFLPKSQWPRSRSTLERLGVRESLSQIEKNNLANLRKGRATRGSRSRKGRTSKKSTGKRQALSPFERQFRKHYSRPEAVDTTKSLRASMMYDAPAVLGAAVRKSAGKRRRSASKASKTSKRSLSKSREFLKTKNAALKRIMKREFGHILSKDEYRRLPDELRRELQLQAYEAAYPAKAKISPKRLLSNKALEKRERSVSKGKKTLSIPERVARGDVKLHKQMLDQFWSERGYEGKELERKIAEGLENASVSKAKKVETGEKKSVYVILQPGNAWTRGLPKLPKYLSALYVGEGGVKSSEYPNQVQFSVPSSAAAREQMKNGLKRFFTQAKTSGIINKFRLVTPQMLYKLESSL